METFRMIVRKLSFFYRATSSHTARTLIRWVCSGSALSFQSASHSP